MGTLKYNLLGKRYGRLTVIEYKGAGKWLCKCDCGNTSVVQGTKLRQGKTTSCGCYRKEKNKKHGLLTHKGAKPRDYMAWRSMRRKCTNTNDESYKSHGGKGIKVCDEWQEYEPFHRWSLENGYDDSVPNGQLFFDRIDTDDDFKPSNCRWTTTADGSPGYTSSTVAQPVVLLYPDGTDACWFPTTKSASDATGISVAGISAVCEGRALHAHGTVWKHADKCAVYKIPEDSEIDEILGVVKKCVVFDGDEDTLDGEEWRPVVSFEEAYEVSNFGRVRAVFYRSRAIGISRYRILAQKKNRTGYMQVYLRYRGRFVSRRVHRLVAEAFIPNPDNLPVVDHIDFDRTNNHVSNLQWLTQADNTRRSVRVRSNTGEKHISKLKSNGRYMVHVDRKNVGVFDTLEEAIRRRDDVLAGKQQSLLR